MMKDLHERGICSVTGIHGLFVQNKLARVVIDRVPCLEMVRFVNSGTEACLSVLRLMRAFTGRNKVHLATDARTSYTNLWTAFAPLTSMRSSTCYKCMMLCCSCKQLTTMCGIKWQPYQVTVCGPFAAMLCYCRLYVFV